MSAPFSSVQSTTEQPLDPIRARAIARQSAIISAQAAQVEAKKRELAIRKLRWFVKRFWVVAEPKTRKIDWSPHLDILCDEIQAIFEESDRRRTIPAEEASGLPPLRLVINIPPRSAKSTIVQKLAPAWRWLHRPGEQILALANNPTLVERDGSALRWVVQSPEYRLLQRLIMKRWERSVIPGRCGRLRTRRRNSTPPRAAPGRATPGTPTLPGIW